MKKMTYVLIAISAFVIGMIAVSWAQMTAQQPATAGTTTIQTAPVAAAPIVVPDAPKPPAAPVAAVQAPIAPVVKPLVSPAPVTTSTTPVPPVLSPEEKEKKALESSGVGKPVIPPPEKAPADFHDAMRSGQFLKKLSFPLTEQNMVEFARASVKVAKINSKWDVQIAGAQTDQMAIEYNNLAVEEIEHSLKSIPGLTLDQYNEMTRLTATDTEFNSVYQAYKQLVQDGAYGAPPKSGALPVKAGATSNIGINQETYGTSVAPITATTKTGAVIKASNDGAPLPSAPASAPVAVTPTSVPANPGTAPIPQGSPTPPYSQPAAR